MNAKQRKQKLTQTKKLGLGLGKLLVELGEQAERENWPVEKLIFELKDAGNNTPELLNVKSN